METSDALPVPGKPESDWVSLEYDFLKHLTSVSLAGIGGAVTFAGSIFAHIADKHVLWWAVAGFVVSGGAAFIGQHQLLRQLRAGKPVGRNVVMYREVSIGVFFAATGAAMAFAVPALG